MREMTLRETTTREYDPKTPVCNFKVFALGKSQGRLVAAEADPAASDRELANEVATGATAVIR